MLGYENDAIAILLEIQDMDGLWTVGVGVAQGFGESAWRSPDHRVIFRVSRSPVLDSTII